MRILRLFRILLFGPLVGHGVGRPVTRPVRPRPDGRPHVTVLRPGETAPRAGDWNELLQWARTPTNSWLHASNLTPERLTEIAQAIGVPHVMIEAALQESSYPRIEPGRDWTALTVSLPSLGDTIRRDPILLLVSQDGVLSLARHFLEVQHLPSESDNLPWGPHCALHIVRMVLARDEELAGRLERKMRQFEELPTMDSSETFFRETIPLKRLLSIAKGDLWRLRGLLSMIADGRRKLPGLAPDQRRVAALLAEEAAYLYETVDNVRESVLSLIELHIDIAAHSATRFMRLMAIVATLALIPAVVGGLLGMNLVGAPFPVTLAQVAYGSLVLTLAVLYIFMAKGWLR